MTMHLVGPALTTTGKKKGKKKFRNADQARKARELAESWKELQKKWCVINEPRKSAKIASIKGYSLEIPAGRGTSHIKSIDTGAGIASKSPPKVYSGTLIKGIATMHKSNTVPIINDQEAKDIASMRR
jgi:hypothetical protein